VACVWRKSLISPWVVLDFKQQKIIIEDGKGARDRIVYMSNDALLALTAYLRVRPLSKSKRIFWSKKGSVRESHLHRAYRSGWSIMLVRRSSEFPVTISDNTMATQLLNADADLCTIQDLLGHSNVKTTQRYCRVSNLKVQRDYFNAMEVIMQRGLATHIALDEVTKNGNMETVINRT